MNKTEELKEFIIVLIVSMGVALLFVVSLTYTGKPPDPDNTFAVVNQYNGCDVIRYTDPSNRYHYFLDCK